MYIDSHCHITFKEYDHDRKEVIANAKKAGVKKFIIPGDDAPSSIKAVELATKYPSTVYAAVGFHPYEAQHVTPEDAISFISSTISINDKRSTDSDRRLIVAIGEIGLDYHLYKGEQALGKKDVQKHFFEEQLRCALKFNLPVIIHCRDAFEDIFSVLDTLPSMPTGVLHCFTGGLQDLRMATDRGLKIGIDGNLTYSKHLTAIFPSIPLTSLLLETDSPYLTPTPHRGLRNEPKYIPLIASYMASVTKNDLLTIANMTFNNTTSLFRLD